MARLRDDRRDELGEADTSNFDPYPESKEEAPLPTYSGKDPFAEF